MLDPVYANAPERLHPGVINQVLRLQGHSGRIISGKVVGYSFQAERPSLLRRMLTHEYQVSVICYVTTTDGQVLDLLSWESIR